MRYWCTNESAIESLQCSTQACNVRLNGIDNIRSKPHTRKIKCKLLAHFNDKPLAIIELVLVPRITDAWLPCEDIPQHVFEIESREHFADPKLHTPGPIDVLLGAGVWAIVIRNGSIINSWNIAFQSSKLGLLVFGGGVYSRENVVINILTSDEVEAQLDSLLRRFWESEEVYTVRVRTSEQEQCEEIFLRTHQRLDNGRFQVDIPLRSDIKHLGSSRAIALHRFRQLERRFQRDMSLKEKYFNSIHELIVADQMRLVDRPSGPLCYHIPHHAVSKKFRIVYDASCPTDCGISLNDVQLVGEKLQDDLTQLIMRFRCHPVAVTADIKKMYLQVRINPAQWDLQRIFWRPSAESDIKEYWLTTVTFELASSPHCAVRAMIEAARESRGRWPKGAEAVEHDFYMDDCLSGAEDSTSAKILCDEMDALLRSYGFVLSKWRSNQVGVVPNNINSKTNDALNLGEFDDTTVLGLRWLSKTDQLMFKFQPPPILEAKKATKRRLLSHIAQIFDPNGYVGPVVIVAKIILQSIWKANISWDTPVPDKIYRKWQQFQQQLAQITEIRLPRWIGISHNKNISLHGFSDASLMAYGAVLYIRVESEEYVECNLIAAKSHVAPVKFMTVPRLELCAAKLLSELAHTFKSSSRLTDIKTTLWSDSQIVLAWLNKDPSKLKIFVNNRVQKIQRLTADADWRFVPSVDNPADLLSRGTSITELQSAHMWWHGPEWLPRQAVHWPEVRSSQSSDILNDIAKEEKNSTREDNGKIRNSFKLNLVMSITLREVDLLSRASSACALARLTAWIFRFVHNSRQRAQHRDRRRSGPLMNEEVERAMKYWIREEQAIYYAREIKVLKESSDPSVERTSSIFKFNPQIDRRGILRMNGRLNQALISEQQRNPVLLPDVSPLAKLLIRHGGPREMIAYLRRKFWITNLRRAIHTSNSQCIACTRQRQQGIQQMMGELPADRVRPCRPFRHSGVDYAGPFLLKARGGRCNILEKKYVAVFVCMVTKAVHIELVDSLSTADFIQAFLCFTSIRGACTSLWSDNGKNFTGAEKELARMLRSWNGMNMAKNLQEYGTEWRFITPTAAHQGGLWEAAIKSMKFHLRRIVGPHKLTSEPIIQPFGANVQEIPNNKLKLAAQVQKMTQSLWKIWSQDYLNELQQRPKWNKAQPILKVGDLVLIREDNIPPTLWKTARVVEIFAGSDGLVRNARLKVATSDWEFGGVQKRRVTLERPVQRLCRLPVDVEAETPRAQCVETDTNIDTM